MVFIELSRRPGKKVTSKKKKKKKKVLLRNIIAMWIMCKFTKFTILTSSRLFPFTFRAAVDADGVLAVNTSFDMFSEWNRW